jgi:hypothetical protein
VLQPVGLLEQQELRLLQLLLLLLRRQQPG